MTSATTSRGTTDLTETEVKETLKVIRSTSSTTIRCTRTWQNLTAQWTVKTYESQIAWDIPYVRRKAAEALDLLMLATAPEVPDTAEGVVA